MEKKVTTTTISEIATTPSEIATTPKQRTLTGEVLRPSIKQKYKLSENQMDLMGVFFLNPKTAISPATLFEAYGSSMHENSIHRFIKRAKRNGWIRELQKIKGATINNLFAFYKEPDKLENGQIIKDYRYKYYQITDMGSKVFEINEKK